jgi:hypothetical protein
MEWWRFWTTSMSSPPLSNSKARYVIYDFCNISLMLISPVSRYPSLTHKYLLMFLILHICFHCTGRAGHPLSSTQF